MLSVAERKLLSGSPGLRVGREVRIDDLVQDIIVADVSTVSHRISRVRLRVRRKAADEAGGDDRA